MLAINNTCEMAMNRHMSILWCLDKLAIPLTILIVFFILFTPATLLFSGTSASELEKEYVDKTCAEALSSLGSTPMETEKESKEILQRYKGKWVKWGGILSAMNETLWGMEAVVKCDENSRGVSATISFEGSWKAQLQQLKVGQLIQFAGQIDDYKELGGFLIKGGELTAGDERKQQLTPSTAQLPGTSAQQPSGGDNESAQSPALSVGDEFVVQHRNLTNPKLSYVGERRIVSLEGNRVRVTARNLNSSYVRTLDYDRQWNPIATRGKTGDGFDYSPPVKYFDFPLYPGKRWSATSTERNTKTGQVREHTINAEVLGWETVTVPAGTFRAIKVVIRNAVRDLQTGQIKSGSDVSWYAPLAKRSVKSELTAFGAMDGRDEVQIAELIRYSVR